MKALITRKLGMTSTISEDGGVAAVTLLSVPENVITQIKNLENDGYTAIQLGCFESKNITKPQAGHMKSAGASAKVMREIRVDEVNDLKIGDKLEADLFDSGEVVTVSGVSKGKGFAGTIKRHNFHRQRKTHGGKGNTRKPGSIGSMYPQKIFKGKKMSGQMGAVNVTTKNLKVALIDKENSIIGVFGAVPGPRKSIVILKGAK